MRFATLALLLALSWPSQAQESPDPGGDDDSGSSSASTTSDSSGGEDRCHDPRISPRAWLYRCQERDR